MKQAIPVTQARRDLLRLVDEVDAAYSRVDLTKNGKIRASIVSTQYLDSLEETIFTLQNSLKDIRYAEGEVKKGEYTTLKDYLKE